MPDPEVVRLLDAVRELIRTLRDDPGYDALRIRTLRMLAHLERGVDVYLDTIQPPPADVAHRSAPGDAR